MRKDPEPAPRERRARVLALERIGQPHAGDAVGAVLPPQLPRLAQLRLQRRNERRRQHDDAVLAALAFAHDDRAALELDVLDAQPQPLHQAHASAVEQLGEEAVLDALDRLQHGGDLAVREHDRQPPRRLRPADPGEPRQIEAEHLLVEKHDRRQRLAVGRHRDAPLGREPRQERLDLGRAHLRRVAHVVKTHERPHPMHIGLLGADAEMQVAHPLAHLVEQQLRTERRQHTHRYRRSQRRWSGALFHGRSILYAHTVCRPQSQAASGSAAYPLVHVRTHALVYSAAVRSNAASGLRPTSR